MTSPGKIRIVVADKNDAFRQGLILILSKQSDMTVVAGCDSGKEAVELALSLNPDLLIMSLDLSLPDDFEVIRTIVGEQPITRILLLSELEAEDKALCAMQAGARGYLPKESGRHKLLCAVREICSGIPCFVH